MKLDYSVPRVPRVPAFVWFMLAVVLSALIDFEHGDILVAIAAVALTANGTMKQRNVMPLVGTSFVAGFISYHAVQPFVVSVAGQARMFVMQYAHELLTFGTLVAVACICVLGYQNDAALTRLYRKVVRWVKAM